MAAVLVGFWVLFQTGNWMVAAGFYFFGLIMGILLISQFWTLANEIYDAATGQAPVRVHRRRREPRRHRRLVAADVLDQGVRHQQPAAGERRPAGGRRPAGAQHRGAQSRPARHHRQGRRGEGRRRQRGAADAPRVAAPAGDLAGHRLRRHRRLPDRAAAEHGGGSLQGPLRRRQPDGVPRHRPALHVDRRLPDPGAGRPAASIACWGSASRC